MDVGQLESNANVDVDRQGCYLISIFNWQIIKLSNPIFEKPQEIEPGFITDSSSFLYLPTSGHLMGVARKYGESSYFVEFFVVDLLGEVLGKIPIKNNEDVWNYKISPDEKYIAYQCRQSICITDLQTNQTQQIDPLTAPGGDAGQNQEVIGWFESSE
jgi:hypothetical protein